MDTSKHPAAALREKITAGLRARGHSNADIDHLPVTVEMWRRIARAAARSRGRPVQTLLGGESAVSQRCASSTTRDMFRRPSREVMASSHGASDHAASPPSSS